MLLRPTILTLATAGCIAVGAGCGGATVQPDEATPAAESPASPQPNPGADPVATAGPGDATGQGHGAGKHQCEMHGKTLSPEEIQAHTDKMMAKLDADQSGAISLDELEGHMLGQHFEEVDGDDSGDISREELAAHVTAMHGAGGPHNPAP